MILTRGRTENYIINLMIGMIFTRCSGILVFTLQFCFIASRPAGLLVNLNKLNEINICGENLELRSITNHDHKAVFMRHFSHNINMCWLI